jgi:hypothetical protein
MGIFASGRQKFRSNGKNLAELFDDDARKVVSSSTMFNDYPERLSRLSSALSDLRHTARSLRPSGWLWV